ncbi:2-amino-4-hydroxy-6-hydroxymethyldihydropteridine diphosphokinase [Qipengyuania xiapuensis]|uniref:2-amino-4-hydroxy-6-hydroxymethyldihydropteridine pyrophosphokinase n=1 Tax=Qipengyuania xiapuensis TaxID=2867236 RepID=A0ABX8ZXI0_9SPHN|nr:2-amino-4-hydroxy-6-hydroxymethyldihydropteridine diphosphokinase [Qipengyuania xiapuensis]QZD93609.1 2-amino-4-hydroxy-6-hydroxymethyldihydropteridine diphosphokinase [Qipengyuania xiapuensis]
MTGARHRYLIALGSNMRVAGIGGPRAVLSRTIDAFAEADIGVQQASRIMSSAPVGPSLRRYANAAVLAESALAPDEMLASLQELEHRFGRRRKGAPWRARPLDLDIVLWSGGYFASPELLIPHPLFRARSFVLKPAAEIAPHWRDPVTGFTLRQLAARAA